jgi:hypothetical protein
VSNTPSSIASMTSIIEHETATQLGIPRLRFLFTNDADEPAAMKTIWNKGAPGGLRERLSNSGTPPATDVPST